MVAYTKKEKALLLENFDKLRALCACMQIGCACSKPNLVNAILESKIVLQTQLDSELLAQVFDQTE